MAAAITKAAADLIRPPDQFFGSNATMAPFRPANLRLAWIGAMAAIAVLAALLLLGWSEIGAGPVSATEQRADPSSSAAAAHHVETQADRMEPIRRRGLDLLRTDFPEDDPSPSPSQSMARGDRLAIRDATIKPVIRIATAGEDESSVALSAPLPARPAARKPAEAKDKHAVEERRAHRGHARRAARHRRDRVRMAHAKYVQVAGEPRVTPSDGPQPDRAPQE
jgi:hypothetical protein